MDGVTVFMAADLLRNLRDWQHIKQQEALDLLGTPQAEAKLAEAQRYGASAEAILRLMDENRRLRTFHKSVMGYRSGNTLLPGMNTIFMSDEWLMEQHNKLTAAKPDQKGGDEDERRIETGQAGKEAGKEAGQEEVAPKPAAGRSRPSA
jgi:hypothetical protein